MADILFVVVLAVFAVGMAITLRKRKKIEFTHEPEAQPKPWRAPATWRCFECGERFSSSTEPTEHPFYTELGDVRIVGGNGSMISFDYPPARSCATCAEAFPRKVRHLVARGVATESEKEFIKRLERQEAERDFATEEAMRKAGG